MRTNETVGLEIYDNTRDKNKNIMQNIALSLMNINKLSNDVFLFGEK